MSDGLPRVSAERARRALLQGKGLLADPARKATPALVRQQVERMAFVQVDTISTVERAHHHILLSRFDDYRPPMLTKLLERDRKLFEHWTHDASVIPIVWLSHWRHRFARYERAMRTRSRWKQRMEGDVDRHLAHVRDRIEREGALRSVDFEDERGERKGASGFWNWKPQKAALEFLWRSGALSIAGRDGFQKRYDLTERVFPQLAKAPVIPEAEHLAWACRMAFDRLVFATPGEVACFLEAVPNAAARRWCAEAMLRGELCEVEVEALDGSAPRRSLAPSDWRKRTSGLRAAPERIRPLSPFDPVIRDRARVRRLFGFDYRFEAFVPASRRLHGYYVLPLLEGDRLVGRIDPKLHRDREELEIRRIFWEPGVARTAARRRRLRDALDLYAAQIGASRIRMPSARRGG